jgi:hypothetical protein
MLSISVNLTLVLLFETTEKLSQSKYQDFLFAVALRPNAGHDLLILDVSRSHTTKHHSR